MMHPVVIIAPCAALSAVLVWAVRRHALGSRQLALPTARDSHSVPTPRGGGLGPALLVIAFLLYLGWSNDDIPLGFAATAIAFVGLIGWIDDHAPVRPRWRLLVHLAAATMLVPLALSLPEDRWLSHPAAMLWWVLWAVSAINVVNFIDGIDGMIGLQVALFGLHVLLLANGGPAMLTGAVLLGVALGFLFWNWSPARIFLGDIGSGALGLAMVVAGLLLIREGTIGLVQAFLPLYPIFLDAAVTLLRRAFRGEPVSQAHRSHLYQRLANEARWGHAPVALLYGASAAIAVGVVHLPPTVRFAAMTTYFVAIALAGLLLDHRALTAATAPHSR